MFATPYAGPKQGRCLFHGQGAPSKSAAQTSAQNLRLVGFFRDGFLEVVERQAEAGFQIDLRFPSQQLSRFGDVGTALLGIILRQRFIANSALRSRHLQHQLRTFQNRELVRIADVHRHVLVRFRQAAGIRRFHRSRSRSCASDCRRRRR